VLLAILAGCDGTTVENRKEHRNPEDIPAVSTPDGTDTEQTDPETSQPACEARVTDKVITDLEDGQVISMRTETMAYDSERRLTYKEIDFDGDGLADYIYTYVFDDAGDPVRDEVDYDGDGVIDSSTDRTFDAEGRVLTALRDGTGDGVYNTGDYYTYDEAGREVLWEYDSGMDGTIDESVATTYDARGNVIEEVTRWGDVTTYSYDSNDCLLLVLDTSGVYTTRNTYTCNDQGQWIWGELDEGDDGEIEYVSTWTYDASGREIAYTSDWDADGLEVYRRTLEYGDGDAWTRTEIDHESDGVIDDFHERSFDDSDYLVFEHGDQQFWLGFEIYRSIWSIAYTNDDQGNPTLEEGTDSDPVNGGIPRDWTVEQTYLPCP